MNFQHNMKAFTKKYTLKRLLALALFVGVCGGAWAQVTGDQYTSTYSGTTVTNVSITHKAPKWTQYHEGKGYNDTYNEADMITLENGTAQVQAANAYVDTIYVHKGTSTELTLPYRTGDDNASIYNYLRWFDYRTDGNYNCGSGTNVVNDLLTPALSDRTTYRFANGYATINGTGGDSSMTKMNFYYPTDSEFSNYTNGFNNGDNSYYIVACDASIYTDYVANGNGTVATFGSTNNWCEPTLSGRAIYYIVGVEDDTSSIPSAFAHYWDLLKEEYQGGKNEGNEHYIDEYEITYPSRRLSDNNAEMVALTKDANAYAIPGTDASADPGELDVTLIDDASLGFNLAFSVPYTGSANETRDIPATSAGKNGTISGNDRIIFFHKGTLGGLSTKTSSVTVPTEDQWNVPDGSTITILVTKTISGTTYNLARYKVNFSDDANLLTQTQVAGLSSLTGSEGYWWDDQTQRSPDYMESNYNQVASLLFDYDTGVNANTILPNGQEHFYPFPMDWSSNGYAFYDGVTSADANTKFDGWGSAETSGYTLNVGTRFSMYSITNDYIGYWDSPNRSGYASPPTNLVKDDGGYWLYIDASERPGTVAEITIDGNLCAGSKLFGTAWIKGAGGANSVDAGALFSIGGVTVNSDGTETHTPILRQATGQVRVTTRITSDDVNEPGLDSSVTGKGEDTNEWFQVYFSFVSDENYYDYYTLRVDNYCAGTDGGDYYFDELKVYVLTPTVVMAELEPLCTTDDAIGRSLIRMDLDYESMMARLGLEPSDYNDETTTNGATTASVDFVIINEAKYYNAIAAGTDAETAFKDALVTFWGTGDDTSDGHIFPTLDFYCNYELNTKYNEDYPGTNVVKFGVTHTDGTDDNDEAYFYYRTNENGAVELSMDCFTNMVAYTEYMILIEPHTETSKSENQKLEEFMALMNDVCAISTEFYMSASITLKINGETADPEAGYCAGQTLVISPEVSYTDESGNNINLEDVYFDWFFGSVEEYTAENATYGGVSLYEALLNFRTYYPDAEELSTTATPPTGDFTQNDYNIIYHYLHTATDNYSNMLVLHMSHLSMRVLTTGLELVIQPIEIYITDSNGDPIDICFGYVPLSLYSSGDAPTLKSGFHNIDSPDGYDPCLRLGLAQLAKCDGANPIIVNLCKATYVATTGDDETTVDHLGVGGEGMEYLYLVDTNDPVYHDVTLDPDFTQYDLPVGKIAHLYATDKDESDDPTVSSHSYMQIYFFDEDSSDGTEKAFTAKEGYYYVLDVHFEEETLSGASIGAVCYGILPLEIKVVPEYLVWTGNKSANWNYDNHWRRADWTDIHMADSASYVTNYQNGADRGYVPMLFTKVIIPKSSTAELYMSGFLDNGTIHSDGSPMLSWVGDDTTAPTTHDDVSEEPTYNIMYDLMLYENASGALKTEHYRVNLCDEIHLEPGAQVLHSEQLIYNKAWTEVQLPQGPWTLQATPLRDVVSGDWYTKTSGTETAEYFKDITWNDNYNYRYTPLLYQRSWGTDDKVILNNYTGTSTSVPSYASTGWSSVYNDTSVPYQSGEGFSIKGNLSNYDESFNSTDSLMFRFPKADTSYTISSSSSTSSTTQAITRDENVGRLLVSDLVTRTVDKPDNDDDTDIYTGTVNVSLTQTGNGYYIIGNPFTAPMSTSEFMKENLQFVGYWTEATYGPIAGNKTTNSWGTDDVLIEPYHAFFVTTNESDLTTLADEETVSVTFTKDMQTTELATNQGEATPSSTNQVAFSVRAASRTGTTSAALAYDDMAEDDYSVNEDVVLMEDESWTYDGMPMVYTVAGDMAASVNWVKSMELVPMGVYADDDCAYTLTFVGTDKLNDPSLFDSYTNTDTALTEGFTLDMVGASHGRYFIHSKGAATEISLTENALFDVTAYSPTPGTVIVSSTAELEDICVYSIGGMLLRQVNASGNYSCTIGGINSGIAIVRAKTSEGTFVKKLRVR